MQLITENSIKIKAELPKRDATKKQEVFYNPVMESNRNISIALINSIPNKDMKIALPLAGSGIRGLRFLKKLKRGKIKEISFNDIKSNFKKTIKENLKLNKLNQNNKTRLFNQDASLFLLQQDGFDYIDLDAFGSPNPFLAAAIAKISRNGILAVTATDTAALTGTYLKSTKRKYWASSIKNYLMHETGLRILIRKVQLQGIQFDKALVPILSYHKDHYFRIYFLSQKGKEKCDEIIKQHQYLLFCNKCLTFKSSNYNKENCDCRKECRQETDCSPFLVEHAGIPPEHPAFQFAGPLWTGNLFDKKVTQKIAKNNSFPEEQKFLDILKEESKKDIVGFYDLHRISKVYKIKIPKMEEFLKKIKAVRTHFSMNGFKSEKNIKEIISSLKKYF